MPRASEKGLLELLELLELYIWLHGVSKTVARFSAWKWKKVHRFHKGGYK